MTFGLTKQDLSLVKSVFADYGDVEKVEIFGSRAMGNFKKGSDVDLVLFFDVSDKSLSAIRRRLNQELLLPYKFDVISWKEISSDDLRQHIRDYGKPL